MFLPGLRLKSGDLTVRPIRMRDARALDHENMLNRGWLRQWEATLPGGFVSLDARTNIRSLLNYARSGGGLPFVLEVNGELVGQINVSGITWGSMCSASIGYWVSERFAGRGLTPQAVALVTDYCFRELQLHRIEICIRPENTASLRVVEKLGFRYEGRRDRYIHIAGDWRDHECFALTADEVPEGLLNRFLAQ
jgi:ribosomal-protein-alanine N-acetyltransferase